VCPHITKEEKIALCSHGALKVMIVMFLRQNGLVLDHPLPIGEMVDGQ
jgi:hypothetical protein